ncbi:sulfatase-like hydrolase/transferase [Niabella insulamsoli]|uniref:sulfatase-like hydrolase/transferase n=1 Tax=Niabella insulamsoli TaxID=3144874 RepID=UPI0031FC8295
MKQALLLTFIIGCTFVAFSQSSRPPNVVLIMADDVSWECFGAYGSKEYQTPHIDALAKGGLRFNHCYSTPLCTPSRVQLMTGKYSFRNYTHFSYLNPSEKTFAHVMKEAGYKTAIAGKWQLNGVIYDLPGASDGTRPNKAGFDEYCLWQLTTINGANGLPGGERFWSPYLEMNGRHLTTEDNRDRYGPDIMSDFLCDFMEKNRNEPFFVYYPTVLVHDPFVPTPDNIGAASRGPEMNKAPKDALSQKQNFVAMVAYLDKIVGKIVKKLEELDQLENTIIIFTADNGTNRNISSEWMGRVIQGGKGTTTDMGTHVPLIISWKGKTPAGSQTNDLVDFTDFYPTLAEIVGAPATTVDGRSFLPQIVGKKANSRKWQALYYQPYWGNNKSGSQAYVRNQEFKLYTNGAFYEIAKDLNQEDNLIQRTPQQQQAYDLLKKVADRLPPLPTSGGKDAKERTVYPDWRSLYGD